MIKNDFFRIRAISIYLTVENIWNYTCFALLHSGIALKNARRYLDLTVFQSDVTTNPAILKLWEDPDLDLWSRSHRSRYM